MVNLGDSAGFNVILGGAEKRKRTQLDFGVLGQQHVLALDVAMDDVMSVQVS